MQDASRLVRPLGDGHEVPRVPVGQNPTFDTNILSLDLGSLADENFPMLNIERLSKAPSNCENCGAVIEAAQACSLCDRETRSADEELHRRIGGQNVIEYDLVSEDESDTTVVPSRPDDGVTLFCIDVSGSSECLYRWLSEIVSTDWAGSANYARADRTARPVEPVAQ